MCSTLAILPLPVTLTCPREHQKSQADGRPLLSLSHFPPCAFSIPLFKRCHHADSLKRLQSFSPGDMEPGSSDFCSGGHSPDTQAVPILPTPTSLHPTPVWGQTCWSRSWHSVLPPRAREPLRTPALWFCGMPGCWSTQQMGKGGPAPAPRQPAASCLCLSSASLAASVLGGP